VKITEEAKKEAVPAIELIVRACAPSPSPLQQTPVSCAITATAATVMFCSNALVLFAFRLVYSQIKQTSQQKKKKRKTMEKGCGDETEGGWGGGHSSGPVARI
jgi:hypothetical protein